MNWATRLITSSVMALASLEMLAAPVLASDDSRAGIIQADDEFPVSPPARIAHHSFYLAVPENRSVPEPRTIELPVVVLRAGKDDGAAPVVMLTGGPGTAGLSAAAYPGAYPWVGKRDFVVFGQRGTHHARPALMCEDYEAALANVSAMLFRIEAARDCARDAADRGIDLSAYNTAESAHDIEALRQVLGAERLTLYGLSYGTRLALAYARQFPDRVEALVLDSPLPFSADYDRELPASVKAVLEAIASRCAGVTTCAQAYPDLWERFLAALEQRIAPLSDPGGPNAAQIAMSITPGSAEDIANAPMLMDAAARGDFNAFPESGEGGGSSGFAWGMRLSVWCSERADQSDASVALFAGIDAPTVPDEVCEAWPAAPRPRSELVDPSGPFPTLILAGEFDTLTPPSWGERLLTRLSRGQVITIPAGLHTVTTNWGGTGCAMKIAGEFIDDPEAFLEGSSPGCLRDEPYPDFRFGS